MDGWHIALYAFAVYLAIRTLVALMRAYERDLRRKLAQEATIRKAGGSPRPGPHA